MTEDELDKVTRAIIDESIGGGSRGTGIAVGFETLYAGIWRAIRRRAPELEQARETIRAMRIVVAPFLQMMTEGERKYFAAPDEGENA